MGGLDPSDGADREFPKQEGGDALSDVVGPGAADRGESGNGRRFNPCTVL